MDGWQKLEVVSKALAAVLIPLAVAYLGNEVATANKQRDSETKFVELATAILSKEPAAQQSADAKLLRKWAVDIINKFSGVSMGQETQQALIQTTALPKVAAVAPVEPGAASPQDTWGVVFGGDATLDEARHETTVTAQKMGIGNSTVFRRAGSFRSVKVFVSKADAEDALGKARALRPSSYMVNMANWCPTSTDKKGYFECSAP